MYFNDDGGRTFVILNERFEVVSGEREDGRVTSALFLLTALPLLL